MCLLVMVFFNSTCYLQNEAFAQNVPKPPIAAFSSSKKIMLGSSTWLGQVKTLCHLGLTLNFLNSTTSKIKGWMKQIKIINLDLIRSSPRMK